MKIDKIFSCGMVPVRFDTDDWRLLVLRVDGAWDFPRGVAGTQDDPLDRAQLAVHETTGLTDLEFSFGEEFRETAPYAGNQVARYYVVETRTADITPQGRSAAKTWRWVTCDEAEDVLPPRLSGVLDWVRRVINEEGGDAPR